MSFATHELLSRAAAATVPFLAGYNSSSICFATAVCLSPRHGLASIVRGEVRDNVNTCGFFSRCRVVHR